MPEPSSTPSSRFADVQHRAAQRVQAGADWLDAFNLPPIEPSTGGMKHSGLGCENGRATIERYTGLKSARAALGNVEAPS